MKRVMIFLLALTNLFLGEVAYAEGSVARAIVATGVADHEPVNDLERVLAGNEKVYFFTELRGMQGQTVKHRWSHGEVALAEVEFNVRGPRWRVWSSKNLLPEWSGEWKVAVIDAAGNVISEKSFTYASGETMAKEPAVEEPSEALGDLPPQSPAATE